MQLRNGKSFKMNCHTKKREVGFNFHSYGDASPKIGGEIFTSIQLNNLSIPSLVISEGVLILDSSGNS